MPYYYEQIGTPVIIQKTAIPLYPKILNKNNKMSLGAKTKLEKGLFEAIDYREIELFEEEKKGLPHFSVGNIYTIKTPSCEGFEMKDKKYEFIAHDDEFGGVKIDGVIMKQISGDTSNIFTLSKNDCMHLGVKFQQGLQLFPKNMSWELVNEEVEFDKHDLSTTPLSKVDNTIRNVVLRLKGFTDYSDGYVVTPTGKLVPESRLWPSMGIIANKPLVYDGKVVIDEGENVKINLITPKKIIFNHGNYISSDDEIYIHIDLSYKSRFGMNPLYVKGFDPNDIFTIYWDETDCKTEKEYLDSLKKEKEAKKQSLWMAENNIRKLNDWVDGIKITPSDFSSIKIYDSCSKITSTEMYIKSINQYTDKITRNINKIAEDLRKLGYNANFKT